MPSPVMQRTGTSFQLLREPVAATGASNEGAPAPRLGWYVKPECRRFNAGARNRELRSAMRHFVQYHNAGKRGTLAGDPADLSVYTRKPDRFVANLLGDTVWLLEGVGSPASYHISLVFVADEFGLCDDPDFRLYLSGTTGRLFVPPVPLPQTEWFRTFRRRHGNFAFGLQAIGQEDARELCRLSGWTEGDTSQPIEVGAERVLCLEAAGPALATGQSVVDLIGEALSASATTIAVPAGRLVADFFQLRSGVAGEMVQKLANYRLKLAVIGDVSAQLAASSALRDWVRECNRHGEVCFLRSLEDLASRPIVAGAPNRPTPA